MYNILKPNVLIFQRRYFVCTKKFATRSFVSFEFFMYFCFEKKHFFCSKKGNKYKFLKLLPR